jgi:hypothetical protein
MRLFLLLLATASLAACSRGGGDETPANSQVNVDRIDSAADVGLNVATPAPVEPPAPGTPGGLANDGTPLSEAPFTADSAQGAADVVQHYYALLEAKRFTEARVLWEPGADGAKHDASAFAQEFADYAEYHANIGAPGRIDAGAGQRYVEVPVMVYGRRKSGAAINAKYTVTLHRTADIDGATAKQKRWHIRSIE